MVKPGNWTGQEFTFSPTVTRPVFTISKPPKNINPFGLLDSDSTHCTLTDKCKIKSSRIDMDYLVHEGNLNLLSTNWIPFKLCWNGKSFFLQMSLENGKLYIWMNMLGSPEVAKNYRFAIR
jgi:hypothetical protein